MAHSESSKKITIARSAALIMLAAVFALGVFLGRSTWLFSPVPTGPGDRRDAPSEEFRFIRQSVLPQEQDARKIRELKPFRYKVKALIDEKTADGALTFAAVHFRDLENGNWFGIHDQEPFSPESQVKIPLMISYFKWAEANPLVLRKKLTVIQPPGKDEPVYLRPPRLLQEGKSYTVNDLIFRMIAYGDNDAYDLLAAHLPPKYRRRIYTDLYVNYDPSKHDDTLSLSAYASFFRVLFNASYLSEEMSEKALRFLSRSSFRDGMAAGLPPGVELASKAGERTIGTSEDGKHDIVQLHEFGIVYDPRRPFLLGITVRGSDYDELAEVVKEITRLIYVEVDHQTS